MLFRSVSQSRYIHAHGHPHPLHSFNGHSGRTLQVNIPETVNLSSNPASLHGIPSPLLVSPSNAAERNNETRGITSAHSMLNPIGDSPAHGARAYGQSTFNPDALLN